MSGARLRLTGCVRVGLPPGEALDLFTPRGEREWAHGWEPVFPVQVADDTEPGTVFETSTHGQRTVWLVLGRGRGRRIRYARVTPGDRAGTVTVTVRRADEAGACEAGACYELTAPAAAAERGLREFAQSYPGYLRSWQEAIERALAARAGSRGGGPRGGTASRRSSLALLEAKLPASSARRLKLPPA